MISYQTYLQIHHYKRNENLTNTQIAQQLGITADTVSKWLKKTEYQTRKKTNPRASKLDSFKPQILRWTGQYRYSGIQNPAKTPPPRL